NDLATPQVTGLAGQDIAILAAQILLATQPGDHIAHGVLRVLHQIRADRGSDEVALGVELRLDRPRRGVELEAPRPQAAALQHIEAQAELKWALDAGNAHLAIALRGVAVAGREQRPRHIHRQMQLRADVQVPRVDIAAALIGGQHVVRARLVERHAHRAAERLDGDVDILAQRRRLAVGQVEVADVRLREILRQQPQPRDDPGPTPVERLQAQNLDLQDITRLGALDVDRPGQRVEPVEIQAAQRRRRHARLDLPIGHFLGLAVDHIARLDLDRWRQAVVPLVVDLAALQGVLTTSHDFTSLQTTFTPSNVQTFERSITIANPRID